MCVLALRDDYIFQPFQLFRFRPFHYFDVIIFPRLEGLYV